MAQGMKGIFQGAVRGLKKEQGYDVKPLGEDVDPKSRAAISYGEKFFEESRSTAQSYANAARSERTMRGSRGRARGGHSGSGGTILGKKR